jgi:hypothetical protein
MAAAAAPIKPLLLPQAGTIKGGRLDGWRYHYLRFEVHGGHSLRVLARCTPPHWPFPHDIRLDPTHFMQLRAVTGERAKRFDARPAIAVAYTREGLTPPAWLQERATIRALVKRSGTLRRTSQ